MGYAPIKAFFSVVSKLKNIIFSLRNLGFYKWYVFKSAQCTSSQCRLPETYYKDPNGYTNNYCCGSARDGIKRCRKKDKQ